MGQEALWLDCAEKLTQMIQNIIEFAKLIPGFMRLSQDDQVSVCVCGCKNANEIKAFKIHINFFSKILNFYIIFNNTNQSI